MPAPPPESERALASELPIEIHRDDPRPIPAQIASGLRALIDRGSLSPGAAVWPTREFAERLGVSRGVVVSAYEQLASEGYLVSGQGRGTRVSGDLDSNMHPGWGRRPSGSWAETGQREPAAQVEAVRPPGPLSPGIPDTSAIDRPAWRTAWRTAITRAHLEAPALGDPRLRAQIAEHLRLLRGAPRSGDDVIVTAGAREGLGLVLAALGATSGRRLVVGVEDPGYPSLRRVASRHGAEIIALPSDAHGPDPRRVPDGLLDAIIITPSHQYPLGGALSLARRRELLAWAERTGAILIEDDYDAELRLAGPPLPPLAGLDDAENGPVVLLGTFSKTISQSLSTGYLLASRRVRALLAPVRRDLGSPVPAVVQAAIAEYLESGEFRRHTARMRRRYTARQQRVLALLGDLPHLEIRPMSGGLHIVLVLTRAAHRAAGSEWERSVHQASERWGLGAVPLRDYWHRERADGHAPGLVIGVGAAPAPEVERAVASLRSLLGSAAPSAVVAVDAGY